MLGDIKNSSRFLTQTIGLQLQDGSSLPLVARGTALPVERLLTLTTVTNNQRKIILSLTAGENARASLNERVGSLDVEPLPLEPRGVPRVGVTFIVSRALEVVVTAAVVGESTRITHIFSLPEITPTDWAEDVLTVGTSTPAADVDASESLLREAAALLQHEHDDQLFTAVAVLRSALARGERRSVLRYTDELREIVTALHDRQALATPSPEELVASPHRLFGIPNCDVDPNLCFVLMPFADVLRPIYDDHIKPVVEQFDLVCRRADDIVSVDIVARDIWSNVCQARLIVAELTTQNANVMYDVGLAHAANKAVILITQSMAFVPFDLQHVRCIVYEYTPRGVRDLEERLRAAIAAILHRLPSSG